MASKNNSYIDISCRTSRLVLQSPLHPLAQVALHSFSLELCAPK